MYTKASKSDEDIKYGKICAKIGVTDPMAKQIIINYWKMSDEGKKLFWNFINKIVKSENDNS